MKDIKSKYAQELMDDLTSLDEMAFHKCEELRLLLNVPLPFSYLMPNMDFYSKLKMSPAEKKKLNKTKIVWPHGWEKPKAEAHLD